MKSLRERISYLNAFPWSLGVAFGIILFFLGHPEWHTDLREYLDFPNLMPYPYYVRWLLYGLAIPPEWLAYLLLALANTALLFFAVRVWGGKHWMMFISFPFAWVLFYGQLDGLVVGGLALAWWALQKNRPYLIGFGLLLASIKPQLALPLALAVLWWSKPWWKALVIPLAVLALSFLQWGFWIPGWLESLYAGGGVLVQMPRNISLWDSAKPWILLVWLPVIFLQLPRDRKALAIVAATMLTMPYFPLPSGVLFLSMAVPVWSWAAVLLPAVFQSFGWFGIDEWMKLLPPMLLIWALWPALSMITFLSPQLSPQPQPSRASNHVKKS